MPCSSKLQLGSPSLVPPPSQITASCALLSPPLGRGPAQTRIPCPVSTCCFLTMQLLLQPSSQLWSGALAAVIRLGTWSLPGQASSCLSFIYKKNSSSLLVLPFCTPYNTLYTLYTFQHLRALTFKVKPSLVAIGQPASSPDSPFSISSLLSSLSTAASHHCCSAEAQRTF